MEPLKLDLAIKDFSCFPVYELFNGKLDYLISKTSSTLTEEDEKAAAIKAKEEAEMERELSELDKEMSRLIGQGLETRKLDRHQPQSSDVHLPYSGLVQKRSSTTPKGNNTNNTANGPAGILLKKKKKAIIKSLSTN